MLIFNISFMKSLYFIIASCILHIFIFIILLILYPLFIFEKNNLPLEKINISNVLSLFRISSSPTLLYLYLSAAISSITILIIIFTAIVFITDFADGKLARKLNEITKIGKYLDAASDYLILFLASFIFYWYGILPHWFFILLILRLSLVSLGNVIIYLKQGFVEHQTSFLGKASVFSIMVLFALNIFKLAVELENTIFFDEFFILSLIDKMEYIVSGIIIVTIFEKVDLLIQTFKKLKLNKNKNL